MARTLWTGTFRLAYVNPIHLSPQSGQLMQHNQQTVVGINPWVLHYNKDVFGDDAGEFRPERWLVSPEEASKLDAGYLSVRRSLSLTNPGDHVLITIPANSSVQVRERVWVRISAGWRWRR